MTGTPRARAATTGGAFAGHAGALDDEIDAVEERVVPGAEPDVTVDPGDVEVGVRVMGRRRSRPSPASAVDRRPARAREPEDEHVVRDRRHAEAYVGGLRPLRARGRGFSLSSFTRAAR